MKQMTTYSKLGAAALLVSALAWGSSHLEAQIRVPAITETDFEESNVLLFGTDEQVVGAISYEYVRTRTSGEKMMLLYLVNGQGTVDFSRGYSLSNPELVTFDTTKGTATRETLTALGSGGAVTVLSDGTVSYDANQQGTLGTTVPLSYPDSRAEGMDTAEYAFVKVGNQIWTRSNLIARHFMDDTPIATGLSKEDWAAIKTPAYTVYDGNADHLELLGGLYNWYAVTSPKGLAPDGLRISSQEDWQKLIEYLDPTGYMPDPDAEAILSYGAGKLIKSTSGWTTPPAGRAADLVQGSNESMLDLIPAGSTSTSRYFNGYSARGHQAYFWTTTPSPSESSKAIFVRLYWDANSCTNWMEDKFMGYSVRCLLNIGLNFGTSSPLLPAMEQPSVQVSGSEIQVIVPTSLQGKAADLYTIDGRRIAHEAHAAETIRYSGLVAGHYLVRIGRIAVKFSL